ncbi:hypothetical protein ACFWWC_21060 [Streptomyces sp. NPDC058642]|uniref:hypothetical protein n=1 Tax=Streptomyces sp. NPDC058642 TaxID=3346572 RepID=UPI00364D1C0E
MGRRGCGGPGGRAPGAVRHATPGTALLDLLSARFARALEAAEAHSPETRQRALTMRIKAFIRQQLRDPAPKPPVMAAAHHISVRYPHRLFQQDSTGETAAARIRSQRLAGAHRDLADPAPSDFIRAFRGARTASRPTSAAYRRRPRASRDRGDVEQLWSWREVAVDAVTTHLWTRS